MDHSRPYEVGSRVDDLDLSGVRLHGPNLERAHLSDAYLVGAQITGDIEGLRINGVEVEPLVEAELDRRFPERPLLRARDLAGLRDAWRMLEARWAQTVARAAALPAARHIQRVDGEWSVVETLRHLIMATDLWVARGIHGQPPPYHPWGIPWSGAGAEFATAMGIDLRASPSLADVLCVREDRQRAVAATLESLRDDELGDVRRAPDDVGHPTGEHTVLHCLHVVLNEEWWHHRYTCRDLAVLEDGGGPSAD